MIIKSKKLKKHKEIRPEPKRKRLNLRKNGKYLQIERKFSAQTNPEMQENIKMGNIGAHNSKYFCAYTVHKEAMIFVFNLQLKSTPGRKC